MITTHQGADFRPTPFMVRDIDMATRDDGTIIVSCRQRPDPAPVHIPALLSAAAASHPGRTWLAQREGPGAGWREVTYGEAKAQVDRLTQGLLDLRLARPVLAILSGNSIEHALMAMAAMQAGIVVSPLSPSYASAGSDFSKLRAMLDVIEPGAVFVQDTEQYAAALTAIASDDIRVLHAGPDRASGDLPAVSLDTLSRTPRGTEVTRAIAAVEPGSLAKLLFTSGSTGTPKAVIHTHAVLARNVVMQRQVQPRDNPDLPPVVALDWLPWSHVMGGNAVFNGILADAGTLYIDDGMPVPALFGNTIRNLREISPTRFANVPSGYAMLADALEQEAALGDSFFRNLATLGYAGARLPDSLYDRLQSLAVRHIGQKIPFVSGYGATEMGPSATAVYWPVDRVGLIGLPHPGVEVKLVPLPGDDRFEVRLRSEGMTPGYYRNPEQTQLAFDEEGYFRTGDAARFADPEDALQGLEFAGRIAEEFKLLTGTFVRVSELRLAVLEACPHLMDVVVTGPDRPFVSLLAWKRPGSTVEQVTQCLEAYNSANTSSSRRVERILFLEEPPLLSAGEVTDKGYVNQRAVLARRQQLVDALYADPPIPDVLRLAE